VVVEGGNSIPNRKMVIIKTALIVRLFWASAFRRQSILLLFRYGIVGLPFSFSEVCRPAPSALHANPQCVLKARILCHDGCLVWCAMDAPSKPFVVSRNKHIAPKERRIERLPSGYSVREFYNHPQGCYWYVITALEVVTANEKRQINRGA
jgi:hypothetical protein